MTTNIKNTLARPKRIASEQPSTVRLGDYPKPKQRSSETKQRVFGLLAFFGPALGLSASCDFLFLKELLISFFIIGMAVLLSSDKHPSTFISQEGDDRAF